LTILTTQLRRTLWASALFCLFASGANAGLTVNGQQAITANDGQTPAAGAVTADGPSLVAVVSITPLKSIVEALLPAKSSVVVLVPPGVSEHGYEIPPGKLAAMVKADLIVTVGLGLEPQVDKFLSLRKADGQRRVVFADVLGLKDDRVENGKDTDKHEGHRHDAEGNCVHGEDENDLHLWLDPTLMARLVPAVADAVIARIAARGGAADVQTAASATVTRKASELVARLNALDAEATRELTGRARSTVVVGHDAWRRFAARYKLTTVPIKGLLATEPTPASLKAATEAVRQYKLTTILVEPQLSTASAKRVAKATGVTLAMLDPLGDGASFATMRANVKAIAESLGPRTPVFVPGTAVREPAK